MKGNSVREALAIVGIFALALGLRFAYLHVAEIWYDPPEHDGIEYDLLATNLVNGEGFALIAGQPYAFRPPGFPFFLALIYILFGRSYLAVRVTNALLGALTCLPIYLFTKRVWNWRAGVIASLGIALHPLLIYFAGMIYPESLMLFLIAIIFLLAIDAAHSQKIDRMLLVGLVSGLLTYLRTSLLILGLAQTVWVWLSYSTFRKRFLACVTLVVVIILVLVPWIIRNFVVFGEFIWISTNGGVTFWAGNNALATGGWIEPSPATWVGPDPPTDLRGWPGLKETESEARFRSAALDWIRSHPGAFLRLLPRKLIRAWGLNFGNEARSMNLPLVIQVPYYFFLGICIIGFILSFKKWKLALILYLPIIVSILTTLVYYGSTRQSAITALSLVIFAALACDKALATANRRREVYDEP
jgi:4-amino-4-deoxy-L-arabinose transferase-like glycosyltransferase